MFDIGPGELIGLAILALIVLGPEKLPRYAADAAKMLRQVRRMARDARSEVTRELGPELNELKLSGLTPRGMLSKHLDDLDDLDTKPAARRSPADGAAPTAPATPPPYDEDAT